MASQSYWGDSMSLTTYEQTDGTALNVGGLMDVEIIARYETNEKLDTADSVKFDDEKQASFRVDVSIGTMKWDVATIQHWLGGSGTSSTGVVDTSNPALFNITGTVSPADGTATNLKAEVVRCSTDEMPIFSASKDEYIQHDVSFTGQDITVTGP